MFTPTGQCLSDGINLIMSTNASGRSLAMTKLLYLCFIVSFLKCTKLVGPNFPFYFFEMLFILDWFSLAICCDQKLRLVGFHVIFIFGFLSPFLFDVYQSYAIFNASSFRFLLVVDTVTCLHLPD